MTPQSFQDLPRALINLDKLATDQNLVRKDPEPWSIDNYDGVCIATAHSEVEAVPLADVISSDRLAGLFRYAVDRSVAGSCVYVDSSPSLGWTPCPPSSKQSGAEQRVSTSLGPVGVGSAENERLAHACQPGDYESYLSLALSGRALKKIPQCQGKWGQEWSCGAAGGESSRERTLLRKEEGELRRLSHCDASSWLSSSFSTRCSSFLAFFFPSRRSSTRLQSYSV